MTGSTEWVTRLGWGLVVVLLTGIGLHLVRYYDALIRRNRGRQLAESQAHWPMISADLDLMIQLVSVWSLSCSVLRDKDVPVREGSRMTPDDRRQSVCQPNRRERHEPCSNSLPTRSEDRGGHLDGPGGAPGHGHRTAAR